MDQHGSARDREIIEAGRGQVGLELARHQSETSMLMSIATTV
jgi:hypothetical protein